MLARSMIRALAVAAAVSPLLAHPVLSSDNVVTGGAKLREFEPVAVITAVSSRDSSGRILKFTDSGNREFAITYDANGRIQSSKATLKEHVSDVHFIAYNDAGQITAAQLGGGYSLMYQHLADGRQVVRDRYGGVMVRTGTLTSGYTTLESSDPTGRIMKAVQRMDQLLSRASSP